MGKDNGLYYHTLLQLHVLNSYQLLSVTEHGCCQKNSCLLGQHKTFLVRMC